MGWDWVYGLGLGIMGWDWAYGLGLGIWAGTGKLRLGFGNCGDGGCGGLETRGKWSLSTLSNVSSSELELLGLSVRLYKSYSQTFRQF
jgi:hypothetical protein